MIKFGKMATALGFKNIPIFLKEVKTELGKVTWLSRKQTFRLTLIVIAASVVVAIFISSLDYLFTNLMRFFL